ncbi:MULTISPECIES: hypothetical protein [unclassified Streptomyces]|uniref:hypothetical protein n=1 Tax=unclassified Streptomyces TaxID=2593676 RepID=UPI00340B5D18
MSDDPSPRQTLAEQVEAHFLKCGRTLTDEDTALAYEITLHIAMLILDGAREQDLMGEESYEAVHGLYANMVGAPQLL